MGTLHLGDNLPYLQAMPAERVQLAYADPPFGTGADRRGRDGEYADTWPDVAAYLAWLRPRLEEIRRVLRPDGTLYLHLDRRSVHHARVLLDELFGADRFRNEVIWHYTGGGRGASRFPHKHDNILVYARGPHPKFRPDAVREPYAPASGYAAGGIRARSGKRYRPHPLGKVPDDVWRIPIVNPLSPERSGYPTQKPEALLERIILAATDPGDLVLDPCCGSGTAPVVAQRLGREWIGIDSSPAAIEVTRSRLRALDSQDGAEVTGESTEGATSPS